MQALIAKGINIDPKNGDNETSLHLAAQNGHTEIVKALIAKGADVNNKQLSTQKTPLSWLIKYSILNQKLLTTVEALLEAPNIIVTEEDLTNISNRLNTLNNLNNSTNSKQIDEENKKQLVTALEAAQKKLQEKYNKQQEEPKSKQSSDHIPVKNEPQNEHQTNNKRKNSQEKHQCMAIAIKWVRKQITCIYQWLCQCSKPADAKEPIINMDENINERATNQKTVRQK